jgi:putative membrane protein
MVRSLLPLLATGLLTLASCGDANKSTTDSSTDSNMANTPAAGADTSATAAPASGDSSTTGDAMSGGSMSGGAAKADPNGPTGPHKDDNEFMMTAAHSDQNEIQQSKMALAKGVTGMAKEMANKMIADHTKSTADLKAIASKKGVTLPTDMDAEHKALAPAMEKLSGKEFETRYLAQMQTDHQKTANTMAAHEKMTQDADLKAFIGKTLPVVEQHLGMAQQGSDMKM